MKPPKVHVLALDCFALNHNLGNLGAAVGPSITGAINAATGNPANSMYLVIAWYLAAGTIMLGALKAAESD